MTTHTVGLDNGNTNGRPPLKQTNPAYNRAEVRNVAGFKGSSALQHRGNREVSFSPWNSWKRLRIPKTNSQTSPRQLRSGPARSPQMWKLDYFHALSRLLMRGLTPAHCSSEQIWTPWGGSLTSDFLFSLFSIRHIFNHLLIPFVKVYRKLSNKTPACVRSPTFLYKTATKDPEKKL